MICRKIRYLRIHRRRTRGKRAGKSSSPPDKPMGVIRDNLTQISSIKEVRMNRSKYVSLVVSKISNVNRKGRHGGGIALIYKQPMTIKIISKGVNRSFEYASWDCNISNTAITVVGLYHPPYSDTNKCTDAIFLDDLAEFLEEVLTSYSNISLQVISTSM